MKAIFSGCFTFICMMFLLFYCINYPALFWGIVVVFGTVIVLGVREGLKRGRGANPASKGPIYKMPTGDSDDEGDIRHHYGYDGTPQSISSPETIQNESTSLGDDEDEHR